MRYKRKSIEERDAVVERLREFFRFNYMTGNQVARQIGVSDTTLYSWLHGHSRPNSPERIAAFLDCIPADRSGAMPTGYEDRANKNWRGIPKPRRCPFCKQAKGEIRKTSGVFRGVCPKCGATEPRRETHDKALRTWNGRF